MKKAKVYVQSILAGILEQTSEGFRFTYFANYSGPVVSLTMPVQSEPYDYKKFPAFFEGLLPEGDQLESMLRREKLDRTDYLSQLILVGGDLVGDVTVEGVDTHE
jgi:serine/threonine-protein kinase HipA